MYVIDVRHYLDDKGDIAPRRGAARRFAEFITSVIAHESDFERALAPGPLCFKCRKAGVDTSLDRQWLIHWRCPHCATEGQISHWEGTFWDVEAGRPPT